MLFEQSHWLSQMAIAILVGVMQVYRWFTTGTKFIMTSLCIADMHALTPANLQSHISLHLEK